MKTIVRLIVTSFTSQSWRTLLSGVVLLILVFCAATKVGVLAMASYQGLGFVVLATLFFGSTMIPSMFSRLAQSRSINLLPYGRAKLLASVFATTVIVAAPVPIGVIELMKTAGNYGVQDVAYYGSGASVLEHVRAPFFWYVFALAVLAYTWTYTVLWSAAGIREHTTAALVRTLFLMFAPLILVAATWRAIGNASVATLLFAIVVAWSAFALFFFVVPRLRFVIDVRLQLRTLFERLRFTHSKVVGQEARLILGIPPTWIFAVAIGFIGLFFGSATKFSNGWLLVLTLAGMVTGGIPANVAANARGLWLRRPLSRTQLFFEAESILWRTVRWRIAALVVCGTSIGAYRGFPWPLIACGALHLAVTTIASVYLGLIQTGHRRWMNAAAGIFTFGLAVLGAVAAAGDWIGVPLCTAVLAASTLAMRFVAKRRWEALDWIVCKPLRIAQS